MLIPQADPDMIGFLVVGICGRVTKYGGANSHILFDRRKLVCPPQLERGKTLRSNIKNEVTELNCGTVDTEVLNVLDNPTRLVYTRL